MPATSGADLLRTEAEFSRRGGQSLFEDRTLEDRTFGLEGWPHDSSPIVARVERISVRPVPTI